jgi:hypothetical protein
MAIEITDERMQVAGASWIHAVPDRHTPGDWWVVSWLPAGKGSVTRTQAVTAMVLAEAITSITVPGDRRAAHITAWAAELGMTAKQAITCAATALAAAGRRSGVTGPG